MKKYGIPALLSLLVVIILGILLRSDAPTSQQLTSPYIKPGKNTIVMLADRYEPSNLTIKKGERIKFINDDNEDHWPASDNHPSHEIYSAFDPRRPLIAGTEWEFTFNEIGDWEYHDHLYPGIRGRITVMPQ